MANGGEDEREEYTTPAEMQAWLRLEIRDAAKALELRVAEATELVTSYSTGRLTAAEAEKRHARYLHRWGEALPGVLYSGNRSDADILSEMDATVELTHGAFHEPEDIRARYRSLFGRRESRGGSER